MILENILYLIMKNIQRILSYRVVETLNTYNSYKKNRDAKFNLL